MTDLRTRGHPVGLAVWAVIGFALIIAGSLLDQHAHLTEWEIALLAAVLAGWDHPGTRIWHRRAHRIPSYGHL
jgi:low temperature requirement protein LtrA